MATSLIDELMPSFDARSRYARPIDAPPERVVAAVRGLRVRDLPVTRALMTLRGVPNLIAGRPIPRRGDAGLLDSMLALGFLLLGERDRELALGAVGRFWRPVSTLRPLGGAAEFGAFSEPGHARAVMDFRAVSANGRCVLTTETRIQATDDASRRLFKHYWRLVSLGSGVIRHELLAAASRRAEKA